MVFIEQIQSKGVEAGVVDEHVRQWTSHPVPVFPNHNLTVQVLLKHDVKTSLNWFCKIVQYLEVDRVQWNWHLGPICRI